MRIRVAVVSEVEGLDGGVFVIGLGIRKNVCRFGCGSSDNYYCKRIGGGSKTEMECIVLMI